MNKLTIHVMLLAIIVSTSGWAAAKPKPKPKLKPKTATNHATLGTKQFSGEDNAAFGTTYTLGKGNPWNVTVNSAAYSCEQLKIGDTCYLPAANQKMLVIHYTVHNPQKGEALMRFDTLHFTVVDAKNTNWESVNEVGAETGLTNVDMQMKPAQKMSVYTAIMVPAEAEMPKLIIKSSDDKVLRYQFTGPTKPPTNIVKPLPAPYADPADASGATALAKVPAKMGVYYPLGAFQLRLDKVETSSKANIAGNELTEGNKWLVCTFTAKNQTKSQALLRFDTFQRKLLDQDGAEVDQVNDLFSATRDKSIDTNIEIGQEMTVRMLFNMAGDVQPKALVIHEGEGQRDFSWDSAATGPAKP